MSKSKNERIISPAGIAVYPRLNAPDTKFDPDGVYKVSLKMSKGDAAELVERIDKAIESAQAGFIKADAGKFKRFGLEQPYKDDLDDNGNETGDILFSFKQKAKVTPKKGQPFEIKVPLFDAKGNRVTAAIWGGSTIKVAFEMIPYAMASSKKIGVSLRLCAVQVINLVSGGEGASADSYGFGEEDGYEAAPVAETTETAGESTDGNAEAEF